MKHTLIPKSKTDRVNAFIGILSALITIFALTQGDYWWALFLGICAVVLMVLSFFFRDETAVSSSASEYSAIIESIEEIGKQLSQLSQFLEKERARLADTETTIRSLKDEQTKLEPVVRTQRETVEAILAAHSERTARHAWKERVLGFTLGVIASLIASFVYGYLRR